MKQFPAEQDVRAAMETRLSSRVSWLALFMQKKQKGKKEGTISREHWKFKRTEEFSGTMEILDNNREILSRAGAVAMAVRVYAERRCPCIRFDCKFNSDSETSRAPRERIAEVAGIKFFIVDPVTLVSDNRWMRIGVSEGLLPPVKVTGTRRRIFHGKVSQFLRGRKKKPRKPTKKQPRAHPHFRDGRMCHRDDGKVRTNISSVRKFYCFSVPITVPRRTATFANIRMTFARRVVRGDARIQYSTCVQIRKVTGMQTFRPRRFIREQSDKRSRPVD